MVTTLMLRRRSENLFSHVLKSIHSNKFLDFTSALAIIWQSKMISSLQQLKIILTSVNFCIFQEIEDGNSKTDFSPDLQRATFP